MSKRTMLSKVQGCLLGVAIGDALGMPVETLTRSKILEVTQDRGIRGFVAPLIGREWVKDLKPGDTTDDWQLTEVVLKSIIDMKGFNLENIAKGHIQALETSTFGWGGTTQQAIEDIRDQKHSFKDWAPNYGPTKGAGNGVIMKISPLVLYQAITKQPIDDLLWKTLRLGGLTHHNVKASTTAYAVAMLMFEAFHHHFETSEQVRARLGKIIRKIKTLRSADEKKVEEDEISERLKKLLNPNVTESSEALESAVGNKFHCIDTMAFTIGTFLRHPTDFRAGVLEAVNAGGDSDTNASIVGALIGINCGTQGIPEEWASFNPRFQKVLDLGKELCEVVA